MSPESLNTNTPEFINPHAAMEHAKRMVKEALDGRELTDTTLSEQRSAIQRLVNGTEEGPLKDALAQMLQEQAGRDATKGLVDKIVEAKNETVEEAGVSDEQEAA
jgi:hypothetical protein